MDIDTKNGDRLSSPIMLDLLLAAAAAGQRTDSRALPPDILRFSLVFRAPPDPLTARMRMAALLGADGFDFFPLPAGGDDCVFVLQFCGVPREQSPTSLFDSADALVAVFDLESCAPDVDPGWSTGDETGRAPPGSVDGLLWSMCASQARPPADPAWALAALRAPQAWAAHGAQGAGVRIGQPDTGVADHRELDDACDLAAGIDLIAGGGPPIDPLSSRMRSPGHGVATGSVVASRLAGAITGVAPAATLVPIRCVDSVILSSGAAVAAAIDHARQQNCDIVSLSLGGPVPFADLRRAIDRAIAADLIVLASAGNCVPMVVYPAAFPSVIAVAAVDDKRRPWKGASAGPQVDVGAPGENVYAASRARADDRDLTATGPRQGGSFAVALTAGCAALWLSRHGRDRVRREARSRGVSVQELFRSALRQTADFSGGWDRERMGAGHVDALELLDLNLTDIVIERPSTAAEPAQASAGLDGRRYGMEASYLAFDRLLRNAQRPTIGLETAAPPLASAALRRAAAASGATAALPALPAALRYPLTPYIGGGDAIRMLVRGAPEGAELQGECAARDYLRGAGRKQVMTAVEKAIAAMPAAGGYVARLRREVVEHGPKFLDAFARGAARSPRDFQGKDRFLAEALIRIVGRPALRATEGRVRDDAQAGGWAFDLRASRDMLGPIVEATGRIDVVDGDRSIHVGAGVLIEPGVLLTNRHVIDAFADPLPGARGGKRFRMFAQARVAFDDDACDARRRFDVVGVIAAGARRIGRNADLEALDLALLEVETSNAAGRPLPTPTRPDRTAGPASKGQKMVAIGYPAPSAQNSLVEQEAEALADRFWRVCGGEFGRKYVCPGEATHGDGIVSGDRRRWAFSHDATTLPGHSGAPIVRLGADFALCGMQVGGAVLRQNFAHSLPSVGAALAADPELFTSRWPL